MKHYLLLRDNKQSGPHTLEELLGMGLRTYDLIWVDGKSAAWRYPAEFPELKEHAPAAPEQPFDRFYRKPSADETTIPTLTSFMREQELDKQKEADRIRFEFPEQVPPVPENAGSEGDGEKDRSRYVAISLPAQDAERPIVVIGQTDQQRQAGTTEQMKVSEEPVGKPVSALFPERNPLAAPRKPAPRQQQPWLQYAAILVGILSFLGLGILIGVKWTRERMQGTAQDANVLQGDRPGNITPSQNSTALAAPGTDSLAVRPTASENRSAKRLKKDTMGNKPLLSSGIVHADLTKELDPAVLQEEARKRRESEEKERVRGNITQVVGLQAGKYKVGVFGGISEFEVTVSNGSGYALDQVVVEVDYLLSNKNVYKTETLRFIDLGPHGSKSLTLPRTGRGVKTESRIVRIDSRELDLAWSR